MLRIFNMHQNEVFNGLLNFSIFIGLFHKSDIFFSDRTSSKKE